MTTTDTVSFAVTKEEALTIKKIVDRAVKMARAHNTKLDRLSLHMDVTACHANGCPLKLEELLGADDFNFSHDVFGIRRHMDRTTGRLTDHFLPRFSRA